MAIELLLADDHVMFREALCEYLEKLPDMHVIAVAEDGKAACELVAEQRPSVVVLDTFMPVLNGVDAAALMMSEDTVPSPRVILLTERHMPDLAVQAVRSGARAYIRKDDSISTLVQAIRDVAHGGLFSNQEFADALGRAMTSPPAELSPRERQTVQLVAEGKTSKEISSIMGVSWRTADHYRERTMSKLDIHSVAELTRYAIRCGLIMP